jgi:hypothetical protein
MFKNGMFLNFVIMYTTQAFMCLVGFVGLKKYKILSPPVRVLEWYIIGSIITDGLIDVMIHLKIHTYTVGSFFNVFELLLFTIIFYVWRSSKLNGILIWIGFITFLLLWSFGKATFEPITGWDNYTGTVSQSLQIGFGGWILLGLIKEQNIVLAKDSRFWILSGIVLYATATFLFFGFFTEMLISNRKILRAIWPLNDAFILLQYYLFMKGLYCNFGRTRADSQTTN